MTKDLLLSLNWKTFFVNNLIPVTLGNIVGGGVFVVVPLLVLLSQKQKKPLNY